MGHSAALITDVIAGDQMADDTNAEKIECVARNVEHLELMKAMKKKAIIPLLSGLTKTLQQLMPLYQRVRHTLAKLLNITLI